MITMSTFSLWYTLTFMATNGVERALWLVFTYQSPLRDLQVHSFALAVALALLHP